MKVLIIDDATPGRFGRLALRWAARRDWQLLALGSVAGAPLPGLRRVRRPALRVPAGADQGYLASLGLAVANAQAVARALLRLKRCGIEPDVILAHPAAGETLYAKEVYPRARLVHYCDWYRGDHGSLGFDPEFPLDFDARARIRTTNALHTQNLENCDVGVTSSHAEHDSLPSAYRSKVAVIHAGLEVGPFAPRWARRPRGMLPRGAQREEDCLRVRSGVLLRPGDPVVSFVARRLEPRRGFHSFVRALALIQAEHRHCHAAIVGEIGPAAGDREALSGWHRRVLDELALDPARTHFLGAVPHERVKTLLGISAAHVHLSYPSAPSHSLFEAMASGCVVVGSRTPPVEEFIRHGETGLLADFFDVEEIAARTLEALAQPQLQHRLGGRAIDAVRVRLDPVAGCCAYEALLRDAVRGVRLLAERRSCWA